MTTRSNFPARRRLAAALLALAAAGALGACKVDVTNPNAATAEAVLSSPAGVRALAVGLQGRIGNAVGPAVTLTGVVAGELGNTDASLSTTREFQRYPVPSANAPIIDPTNPDLLGFWSTQFQVIRTANDLLAAVNRVTLDPGTRSGITALALTARAQAYGTLADAWERVPLQPDSADRRLATRPEVLARVLDDLAAARAALTATPVSTEFTRSVLQASIDLPNTIRAFQARYALAAGRNDQALAFANEVPATATSRLSYTTVDQNPLWSAINGNRYFSAIATFRTGAEAGDTRVGRFTGTAVTTPFGGAQVVPITLYTTQADPFALFTQDELALIRAEALARLDRLPEALAPLNQVRAAAGLPARTAAELPTRAAVLDEVLRQRQYALFLTGTRWADLRRFGLVSQARTPWLPVPAQEGS